MRFPPPAAVPLAEAMSEHPPQTTEPGEERLHSWKEIAAHFSTTGRTVQRWERESGLPVHRLSLGKRPTVYAYRSELDAWLAGRSEQPVGETPAEPEVAAPHQLLPSRRRLWRPAAAVLGVTAALGLSMALGLRPGLPAPEPFQPIALTSGPVLERSPALSPDGSRLAYVRLRPGALDSDILLMDLATRETRKLAAGPKNELSPAWSPDGSQILYLRETLHSKRMLDLEVVLVDAEAPADELGSAGSVLTELSRPVLYYGEPLLLGPHFAWALDGRSIILPDGAPDELVAHGLKQPRARGLFRFDLQSRQRTRLTDADGLLGGDTEPALSPDGRLLAFVRRFHAYYSELFVLDLSAPNEPPRRLTRFHQLVLTPRFVDGGRRILFSAGELGAGRALYSVASDGAGEPRRIFDPGRNLYDFDATADGSTVVFTRGRPRSSIWGLRTDSAPYPASRMVTSAGADRLPALSPDGKTLAFFSDRGDSTEIWLAGAEGANPRQLTKGAGEPYGSLDWSPDGRSLATTLRRPSGRRVFRVDAASGALEQLTAGEDDELEARWGPRGKWVYFSALAEGAPTAFRVPATGGPRERVRPAHSVDFSPDGETLYFTPANRALFARLDGKSRKLPPVASPRAFAPVRDGHLFLRPGPFEGVMLERYDLQGRSFRYRTISNSRFDLTADAAGLQVRWSQAEPPEGDLLLVRLER